MKNILGENRITFDDLQKKVNLYFCRKTIRVKDYFYDLTEFEGTYFYIDKKTLTDRNIIFSWFFLKEHSSETLQFTSSHFIDTLQQDKIIQLVDDEAGII